MPLSNVPLQGVTACEGAMATGEEITAAQGKDAAAGRGGASTRGARRFATRGARSQAVSRMTPAEKEAFWAEEAR